MDQRNEAGKERDGENSISEWTGLTLCEAVRRADYGEGWRKLLASSVVSPLLVKLLDL